MLRCCCQATFNPFRILNCLILLYIFVVEIIEENTKLRFNVLFWCEKIRLLYQVVIKLCCNLLIFEDRGVEIAEWCSPWTLVVNWLLSCVLLFRTCDKTTILNSYSLSPPTKKKKKKKSSLFLLPNFEFLVSVCLHFSIIRTLASCHFINLNNTFRTDLMYIWFLF